MEEIYKFQEGIHSRPFSTELRLESPLFEFDYGGVQTLALESLTDELWPIKIVDLSYWQGAVDFEKLSKEAQVVILRYAYGNGTPDGKLDEYYKGATDNNLVVMGYHFLKAGKDWSKHASFFTQLLSDYPAKYAWGDAEDSGGLSKAELDSWYFKYFNRMIELRGGVWEKDPKIGVYTSKGYWDYCLPRTDWAKYLKLWVASWCTTCTYPSMPADWLDINNPKSYTLWQWSSKGDGAKYGVSSKYIDLNRYYGTISQFNEEFDTDIEDLTPPPPPPVSKDFVICLVDGLRVRSEPTTNSLVKDYLYKGTTTEALEEYSDGSSNTWVRLGYKQWSAMKYFGNTYLEYTE